MTPIAILSVAISVAVVIVSLGVIGGFKSEISNKITALSGDVFVRESSVSGFMRYGQGQSSQQKVLSYDSAWVSQTLGNPAIERVEAVTTAPAIIQTTKGVQGVQLRGVDAAYNWSFIGQSLTSGRLPTDERRRIVISDILAQTLGLEVGDVTDLLMVGDSEPMRARFQVAATYNTGMQEFDRMLVLSDIESVRRMADYDSLSIDGYHVYLREPTAAAEIAEQLNNDVEYEAYTAQELYPSIFDWLSMLDLNMAMVVVIMLLVAAVNMVCGLLIIILESRGMVGVLLSQGITGGALQRLFLMRSLYITFLGLFWGNLLGLGICWVQGTWGILELDAGAYMLSRVPIALEWGQLALLNALSVVALTLIMFIPTAVLSRISPDSSMRVK